MNEILSELEKLAAQRAGELVASRSSGVPLVEYSSTFIPEELIRAAGANTYLMCSGGQQEAAAAVLDDMLSCINPLARSIVGGFRLGNDEVSEHTDLVVTAVTDCHIGRLSELLEFQGIRTTKVGVPPDWKKDIAFDYYVRSLRKMMVEIEKLTGKPADMELARRYFSETNRINAAFRRINELRKRPDPPISFKDYMRLQHLSFIVGDTALTASKLESLCDRLEKTTAVGHGAPRLIIMGRVIAIGDYQLISLIDRCGAEVVAELLDEGVRASEKDVELEGDLLLNFARNRYLDKTPIDIFQPAWHVRMRRLKELIDEYRADGVIWYQLAYDEIYDMEYTCVANELKELGVPLLRLETNYSYTREELSLVKTQIESFVGRLCRD